MTDTVAKPDGASIFDPAQLHSLPEAARRYLSHSIRPGTVQAKSVRLRMRGRLRTAPRGRWTGMRATQVISFPQGFEWRASAGWLLRITGHDRYAGGQGEMSWNLWGVLPVVRESGPDVSRSARGRLAAECVFLPGALLPQPGVRWTALDRNSARVELTVDGHSLPLDLQVRNDGSLESVSMLRWGNHGTARGVYEEIPFGAFTSGETTFAGYTIPARIHAVWRPGSWQAFHFFDAEIVGAEFSPNLGH